MPNFFKFLRKNNVKKLEGVEHEKMNFVDISWMELLSLSEEKLRKKIRKNLDKYYKKTTEMKLEELKELKEKASTATKHQPMPPSLSKLFPMDKVDIVKSELINLIHAIDKEIDKRNQTKDNDSSIS